MLLKTTVVFSRPLRSTPSSITTSPLITSWARPLMRSRYSRASASSAGLPNTSPSRTTSVSQAITRPSLSTAAAFRLAFSTTRCSGSPWVSSSTPGTTTSNSTPRFCRISRRWGDPDGRTSFRDSPSRELGEPDPDLALGRLVGVGAVDHVEGHLEREIAADRAGRGLDRVGGADHLPGRFHRFGTLQHHRHQGAAGDEGDELAEEGLVGVLGVVLVGGLLADAHRLQGGDPQPLALEAGDHFTGEGAFEGVRLDEDQGPAHAWGSFALCLGQPLLSPPAQLFC